MLMECNCWYGTRKCKYFLGIKNDSKPFDESKERYYCKAFPNEIPDKIAFEDNKHTKPYPGDHGIRYEKIE
jgi:hypothetical protein